MPQPTLMVLAAGMGSRYGGLKQVDPIGPGGEVILDYSVYDAIRAGFGKVVFIIREDIEEVFKQQVTSRFDDRVPCEYVYQNLDDLPEGFEVPAARQKPWGTAHAMWVARRDIGENFAVINADDFYGHSSFQLLADHLSQATDGDKADYSMIGYILRNTLSDHGAVNRGICELDADGNLKEIVETLKLEHAPEDDDAARYPDPDAEGGWSTLPKESKVSMNMFGFTPSIFQHIDDDLRDFLTNRRDEPKAELYIPTVVNRLIKQDKAVMRVLPSQESWFGVTYPEDKPAVETEVRKLIAQGQYPEHLWA